MRPPESPEEVASFQDAGVEALLWQPVMDRSNQPYGYESLVRLSGQTDTSAAIAAATPAQLWEITREVLSRLCNASRCLGTRHFVNLEKSTLAEPRSVDLLLAAQRQLALLDCELVVEITERPLRAPDQQGDYLRNLRRLQATNIALALDDCAFPPPSLHQELAERLCKYVKIDLHQLGIPLQPDACSDDLRASLGAALQRFADHYQVLLIAEVIETQWQYDFAKALPFSYFQGYYLQRPQPV